MMILTLKNEVLHTYTNKVAGAVASCDHQKSKLRAVAGALTIVSHPLFCKQTKWQQLLFFLYSFFGTPCTVLRGLGSVARQRRLRCSCPVHSRRRPKSSLLSAVCPASLASWPPKKIVKTSS